MLVSYRLAYLAVPRIFVAGLMLSSAFAAYPASAVLSEQSKPKHVTAPLATVMKGLPTMVTTPSVVIPVDTSPLPAQTLSLESGQSLLDDAAELRRPVSEEEYAGWQSAARTGAKDAHYGRLLLKMGEVKLGTHWPAQAEKLLDEAASVLPVTSPDRGLARFDSAMALRFQGRFGAAKEAFRNVAGSRLHGVDRRLATILARHCAACEGYHFAHGELGIPEPSALDPLCGVASLAVCLTKQNLPHDKKHVSDIVRHDGEGSNLQDLINALPQLGLTGQLVITNEAGIQKLPKPIIAHVERDHFITIVAADKKGVEYFCSDCGPWPGGAVHLTWAQWRAMEADRFLVVAKPATAEALMLENLPLEDSQSRGHVYVSSTSLTSPRIIAIAEQMLAVLGVAVHLQGKVPAPTTAICGDRGQSHGDNGGGCPGTQGSGGGANGPGGGSGDVGGGSGKMHAFGTNDPTALATAQEEYTAQGGLRVYNPTGPSVHWTPSYYSLANVTPNGFGSGWTHPYNIRIEDNSSKPLGPQPLASGSGSSNTVINSTIVLPNSGRISFAASSANPPTAATPVKHLTVQVGLPVMVDWYYNSVNSTKYFVVTLSDRSSWTFEPCNGTSTATGRCYPIKLADRVGNYINLNWSTFSFKTIDHVTYAYSAKGLTSITDSSNVALLSINYDSNARTTSVNDCYNRSVYYTIANFNNTGVPAGSQQTNDELTQASQIATTGTVSPPLRFQYGYQNYGNTEQAASETIPYLHTIAVPSATGVGLATATINYNSIGEVSSTVDANGNQTVYSVATVGTSPPIPQPNSCRVQIKTAGGSVLYQYDKYFDGNMSQTKLVNGNGQTVWSNTFADANTPYQASATTDGNGRVWNATFDAFGHLKTSTSPKGTVTTNTYSYTAFTLGELVSSKEGAKTATSFTYNEPSGQVATVSTPVPGQSGTGSTQTSTYSYDSVGNLSSILTPGNNVTVAHSTSFGYTTDGAYSQLERLGQAITVTDSRGKVSHLRYDARSNLTSTTDALGNQSQTAYNVADQAITTTLPATGQTGVGNSSQTNSYLYTGGPPVQTSAFDESNNAVRTVNLTYGKEGETLTRTGSTEAVTLTYDAVYRTKTLADGNNNATTYTYDLSSRVTQMAYPGATGANYDKVMFTSYDPVGNLLSRTDGNGQVTNYTYADTDGLLTAVAYPTQTQFNLSMGYDGFDRATTLADATGAGTVAYDDLGSTTAATWTYTGLAQQSMAYAYYPDGSRQTMTNVGGTWSYSYDANGRYTSLVSPAGTSSAAYLDNGWQSSRTLPNGAVTSYSYNALGLLSQLNNQTSLGASLSSYGSFNYDGVFNLTGVTGSVPGAVSQGGATSFGYDSKDRLTQETSQRNGRYAGSFAYDSAGNPTTFKGTSQGFNANNQQTSNGTFVYDGNGNPTTYRGSGFTFDPENRATAIGATWTAGYRADGLRGWKSVSGTKTYYLYDQGEPVVELNAAGAVQATNVLAPDGLVARQQSGTWTQYTFDQQGNVAQRLNASQVVTSSSTYDAYGVESSSGTPNDVFGYNARWGYLLDRETGLYLCQHRYYDPGTGRWVTRDPIGAAGGINIYSYCSASPGSESDSSGYAWLFPLTPAGLPGWCQDNHGGPYRVDGGNGRYFPPGSPKDGLEFNPGKPGAPGEGGKDHWHIIRDGKKRDGHYEPGDEVPGNLPEPVPVFGPPLPPASEQPGPAVDPWKNVEVGIGVGLGIGFCVLQPEICIAVGGAILGPLFGGGGFVPVFK